MTISGMDAARGGRDAPGPTAVDAATALLRRAIAELTDPQSGGYGRRSVEVVIRDHRIVSIESNRTDTHKV